eukprot:3936645-Rhodomonas_salina.4
MPAAATPRLSHSPRRTSTFHAPAHISPPPRSHRVARLLGTMNDRHSSHYGTVRPLLTLRLLS